MIRYEVQLKRLGEYRMLFNIFSEYHIMNINRKYEGRTSIISFAVSRANSKEVEERLKESRLISKVSE